MNKRIAACLVALLCLLTFGACKNNNSSGPYSMNWTQGGTSYSVATDYVISSTDSIIANSITVQGQATNATISLYLYNYKRITGTFPINLSLLSDTINSASALYLVSGVGSQSALYGTATVTSVTSSVISGTFSFTCTDSTKVTNGTFTCKAQ